MKWKYSRQGKLKEEIEERRDEWGKYEDMERSWDEKRKN